MRKFYNNERNIQVTLTYEEGFDKIDKIGDPII
jgi:hypothetical protein